MSVFYDNPVWKVWIEKIQFQGGDGAPHVPLCSYGYCHFEFSLMIFLFFSFAMKGAN
jgi:hypothetical protein